MTLVSIPFTLNVVFPIIAAATFISTIISLSSLKRMKLLRKYIYIPYLKIIIVAGSFILSSIVFVYTILIISTNVDKSLSIDVQSPDYKEYIQETNPSLLEHLHLISTEHIPFITAHYMKAQSASGRYELLTRDIYIRKEYMTPYVWWHELGHHIWYWFMTKEEQKAFKKIHDADMKKYGFEETGFPSQYSKTDVEEDFAESFAAYMDRTPISLNWRTSRGLPRIKIIEKVIQKITGCKRVSPTCIHPRP